MSAPAALLELQHVAKSYVAAARAAPVPVLKDVSLVAAPGATLAITGPSGCGKSTLLNLIGTLDTADAGKITLDGEDLTLLPPDRLSLIRNQKIGFIFQSHFLLPQCSVLENVLVPTLVSARTSPDEAIARARQLLQRVGLGERLSHRPGQLSGGERQRVAVVRALINRPKLLLADEPTGALDAAAANDLITLLLELNREENVTLILVTHAPEFAARMQKNHALRDGTLSR